MELNERENEYDREFLQFLKRNNLDFEKCFPKKEISFRYIRLKPNSNLDKEMLEKEFNTKGKKRKKKTFLFY